MLIKTGMRGRRGEESAFFDPRHGKFTCYCSRNNNNNLNNNDKKEADYS